MAIFLSSFYDGSNKRRDAYSGSVENRVRLLLEVVDAVARIFGHDAIGVRMSPHGRSKGGSDSAPTLLFRYALAALSTRKLAYVHLIEPRYGNAGLTDAVNDTALSAAAEYRSTFNGPLVSAGGYIPHSAERAVAENRADAVAFGRLFIANPDLPARIAAELL